MDEEFEDKSSSLRLVEEGSLIRLEGDPVIEYLGPEDLMLASTSQIMTQSPSAATRCLPQPHETVLMKPQIKLGCHRCDYKSSHRNALERHIQAVHDKVKLYECDRCDYKTGHSSALKRHVGKLHEKSSQLIFACDNCDYHTVHKSALKRHVANRHQQASQVRHQCSVCEYSTTYEFALERHISTVHLKEGSFECSLCEYNTVHKHALDRHIKMVHKKPAHLCCEMCDYKTAHRSALKMHFATAHELKETFKCNKCGYETLYKTALHRHLTTVTCGQGEKVSGAGSLHKISQDNMRLKDSDSRVEDRSSAVNMGESSLIYLAQPPDAMSSFSHPSSSSSTFSSSTSTSSTFSSPPPPPPVPVPVSSTVSSTTSFSLSGLSSNTVSASMARRHDVLVGSEMYQIAGIQRIDGSIHQMVPVSLSMGGITVIEKDGILQPITLIERDGVLQPVTLMENTVGNERRPEFQPGDT